VGEPTPPAIYLIATEYRDNPMAKITVPVTSGGKNFISFLRNIPKNMATNPPINCAPKTVARLNSPVIAARVGTYAKLTPIITGSFEPITLPRGKI
jgi:hypothetical protein